MRLLRPLLYSLPFIAAGLAFVPSQAEAFPWMIHHSYTQCVQCHVDPSGGGALTSYGRAQGEILLRTHYKEGTIDVGESEKFFFGLLNLPDNDKVVLQADVRSLVIPEPGNVRFILMQADLRGALQLGDFVAYGALGPVSDGGEGAWLTSNEGGWNLTARQYWLGYRLGKKVTLRAGRMDLPFGIRTEDHVLYARQATRTNTNDDQQVGLAMFYGTRKIRAEVMGIAGNYQLSPDMYRERGYSGYFSYAIKRNFELGVSSLMTVAQADIETYEPRTRQAHGVFLRYAPVPELAIMAESNLLVSNDNGETDLGIATTGIIDYEPLQGLHIQGIGQHCDRDFSATDSAAWTAGGGVQWFFAPRVDVRVDVFDGVLSCTNGVDPSMMGLVQAHFFL